MTNIVQAMDLVLWLGAAVHDATPEQRERLRLVPELMRGKYLETGDESEVRSVVRDIMGPAWEPSDEWRLRP